MLTKRTVVFRADGNTQIGLGHISRCLAIAEKLKQHFTISFAIQNPDPPVLATLQNVCEHIIFLQRTNDYLQDANHFVTQLQGSDIVVLDGYSFDSAYQLICKRYCYKVVYIDDLHATHIYADVIINHCANITPQVYQGEAYTRYFLGTPYAILRNPFLKAAATKRTISVVDTLFISMGGADIHNYSLEIIKLCASVRSIREIFLLTGSANPHLNSLRNYIETCRYQKISLLYNLQAEAVYNYMLKAQIAICASSVIAYEACCAGIGLLLYKTASNQSDIYQFLTQQQLGIGIESLEWLPENIDKLATQPHIITGHIQQQKKYFDGKSMERIEAIFNSLLND